MRENFEYACQGGNIEASSGLWLLDAPHYQTCRSLNPVLSRSFFRTSADSENFLESDLISHIKWRGEGPPVEGIMEGGFGPRSLLNSTSTISLPAFPRMWEPPEFEKSRLQRFGSSFLFVIYGRVGEKPW